MLEKGYLKDLYRANSHEDRTGFLRLDMNENPEGLQKDFFKKVMDTITPEMIAAYPDTSNLQALLAGYLNVDEDNILLTNGSDDAIKTIYEVFGNKGQKIVSVYPTFEMYSIYARIYDMQHKIVEYSDDLSVNIDDVLDAINENTAIVSLLNPNNPIGNVYSQEELIAVIEKAEKFGAVVIVDEAYFYFYDKTFIDIVKLHKNAVLTRTFSKLCSIAGLRIGYAVGNAEIISLLSKVKSTYSVNCVALRFAEEIIKDENLIQDLMSIEKEGRAYLINQLQQANIEYYAKNGNYVFIKPSKPVQQISEILKQKKILIKTYKHPLLKDFIRISTGSVSIMKKFWEVYKNI